MQTRHYKIRFNYSLHLFNTILTQYIRTSTYICNVIITTKQNIMAKEINKIDNLFERLNNSPLYVSVKEKGAKKHTPYNFRVGYTNILGATRFGLDKLNELKDNIITSVDRSKVGLSIQIVNIETKKIIFKYGNI